MNTRLLYILIIILSGEKCMSQSQSIKSIELAFFDVNSPRTKKKDNAEISLYATITNGQISFLKPKIEDFNVGYYISKLTQPTLQKIDSLLNRHTKLKEHLVIKSMGEGHFAGSYTYILVKYKNGKKDELCYIDGFISELFQSLMNDLENIFYRNRKLEEIKKISIPIEFSKSLQAKYKQSKYLPPIEFPPPIE